MIKNGFLHGRSWGWRMMVFVSLLYTSCIIHRIRSHDTFQLGSVIGVYRHFQPGPALEDAGPKMLFSEKPAACCCVYLNRRHFVSSVRAPFVWQVWWSQYSWNIVESSASLKPIGSIAPNWTSRLKDPHRRYLLSAVQVHATTHCRMKPVVLDRCKDTLKVEVDILERIHVNGVILAIRG
jgi:hypothetical protein